MVLEELRFSENTDLPPCNLILKLYRAPFIGKKNTLAPNLRLRFLFVPGVVITKYDAYKPKRYTYDRQGVCAMLDGRTNGHGIIYRILPWAPYWIVKRR